MRGTGDRGAIWGVLGAMALLAVVAGLQAQAGYAAQGRPATGDAGSDLVKRGEYLVKGIGCADCHTPQIMGPNGPEPDPARTLSGHPADAKLPPAPAPSGPWVVTASASATAWAGPWGVSYSANLTPHETGLGTWTEQQFVDTLRNGRHQGRGRPILPPMPWQSFAHFSDEDLRAIFAYLRTMKPIDNKVPDPMIAGPPPTK